MLVVEFLHFLDYIYTGRCSITFTNVQDLLIAADLYNIDGIGPLCCEFMAKNLAPDNCLGVRNLSYLIRVVKYLYIFEYYFYICN